MDKNYEWFLKADLTPYAGKYVAIAREQVIASGDDPGSVYETVQQQYPHEEVLLWKVMPSGVFVFRLSRHSWVGRMSLIGSRSRSNKPARWSSFNLSTTVREDE